MDLKTAFAWIWENYGKTIIGALCSIILLPIYKKFRRAVNWPRAKDRYLQSMLDLHGTTSVLSKPAPLSLDDIFTDVFILDKPQAFRPIQDPDLLEDNEKRIPSLRLVTQSDKQYKDRLFILGQPGAGKTTFLKHLTLKAAAPHNHLSKIPIFISLKEWSDTDLPFMAFIEKQFAICQFPEALDFITDVLGQGQALVLCDGLDEVNQAQREAVICELRDFSRQYRASQMIISCRIAAMDYSFEQFTYVKMAHFNESQGQTYVRKWFADNPAKGDKFLEELALEEHRGLRELGRVPLLLSLLCLGFEELGTFPHRREEIYEEALEALLKKWDKRRNIFRDEIYRKLSLMGKRQLLSHLAFQTFKEGDYFLRQKKVEAQIVAYLQKIPPLDAEPEIDGEAVLKAIEAQHGILVERARQIYAFAHLSFQEYFTAKYIVDNEARGSTQALLHQVTESRWREVFLLTASLLDEADDFFALFQKALDKMIAPDDPLVKLLHWVKRKTAQIEGPYKPRGLRSIYLYLGLIHVPAPDFFAPIGFDSDHVDLILDQDRALDRARALSRTLDLDRILDHILDRARDHVALSRVRILDPSPSIDLSLSYVLKMVQSFQFRQAGQVKKEIRQLRPRYTAFFAETVTESAKLDAQLHQALAALTVPAETASEADWQRFCQALQDLMQTHRDIGHEWHLSAEQIKRLNTYLQANLMLVECLNLAYVSDREAIENKLLLPP